MAKFTPPTTFPHECLKAGSGFEVTLWAPADAFGDYPATVTKNSDKINLIYSSEDLMDKPVVAKRWFNVYAGEAFLSRPEADASVSDYRIYVLREETCDGEITIYKEDV